MDDLKRQNKRKEMNEKYAGILKEFYTIDALLRAARKAGTEVFRLEREWDSQMNALITHRIRSCQDFY
jgi:hypothetical protein